MEVDRLVSLERALAKTEADADAAFRAATAAVSSLKKFRAAAKTGNLRELRKTIESAEQAITVLSQQFIKAKEGWTFDEETYLSGRAFLSEILEAAGQIGMKIFEQDDRLYCYPFLIRIMPNERSILIDVLEDIKGSLLGRFSDGCKSLFDSKIHNTEAATRYSNIITNRHLVAHGMEINITFDELVISYQKAGDVLAAIRDALCISGGAP